MIPPEQCAESGSRPRGKSGGVRQAAGILAAATGRTPKSCFSNSAGKISSRKILAQIFLGFIFAFFSAHPAPAATTNSPASPTNHWAFQPLQRPAIPRLADTPAPNPIDAFIRAALAAHQLAPAPPADPRTLIRRLSFTLLGLPPTPAEADAFAADWPGGSDATQRETRNSKLETLLTRLLSSPHFGERFARHWMDVVRYADTHGTEHDAWLPHAWRYRDYLVRAFNADLPYDQFIREHVAGDLLAPPRWNQSLGVNESLLGSAWWRLVEFNQTPVDVKGEEVLVVDSQIDAYSKAFLGLTVSCARCHDHKFDPISQRDFHGLYSILASTRTSMRVLDPPEFLAAKNAELAKLKSEIRAALAARWGKQIELWPAALAAARVAAPLANSSSTNPAPTNLANEKFPADLARETARWRTVFATAGTNKSPLAPLLRALRDDAREISSRDSAVEKGADPRVHVFADFTSGESCGWFGTGGFAQPARAGEFCVSVSGTNALGAIYPSGRYSHLLSDKHAGTLRSPNFIVTNKFISALVTGDNNARFRLVLENFQGDSLLFTQITPKLHDRSAFRWVTLPIRDTWRDRRAYLELTPRDDFPYLGIVKDAAKLPTDGRSAAGISRVIFHNGEPLPPPPAWPDELTAALDSARTLAPLPTPNSPNAPTRPSFAAGFTAATRHAIAAWSADRCTDAHANYLNHLLQLGLLANTPQHPAASNAPLAALVARYRELEAAIPVPQRVVGVTDEAPGFDEAFFPRGNHLQPGAPESRRFLSAFSAAPYRTAMSGRRELAEDTVANPLAARVLVNRLWHHVFGAGLVRTTDNFGKLGDAPSHPELLDWLAGKFIADGWSVKSMLRLMLTSETFAASVASSDAARVRDPDNRLLSHASLRRLDAESIRDAILAVSGRLDPTPGGPGVPVPVPAGHVDNYSPTDGPLDGRGRRSLYLEVRRNHPAPFLLAFDQPKPASPMGRREPTNVPAQSLALLNDPFVNGQAQLFATRALAQPGDDPARIRWMLTTALQRSGTDSELTRAHEFLTAHPGPDGWRDYAHALFNLKEFVYLK